MYKTGGGIKTSSLSGATQKIIGLLGDRMDPLDNNFYCDMMYNGSKY